MTAASCDRTDSGTDSPTGAAAGAADSVLLEICVRDSCAFLDCAPIRSLDCLVYNNDDAGTLAAHARTSGGGARMRLPEGVYEVIAIANSPRSLNLTALYRRETADLLEFQFEDDDPECPIMGARASTKAPGACEMVLEPLMSAVCLSEVSNSISGYVRLVDPQVFLQDLNPSAKILRTEEFRPSETIERGTAKPLPCDVGVYTQYPGTMLYCYPNDTPENLLGVTRTSIALECGIGGEDFILEGNLPPLGRNCLLNASLTVDSPGEFKYSFSP